MSDGVVRKNLLTVAYLLSLARSCVGLFVLSLSARLDAERERWFLCCAVAVGLGIMVYFTLPWEPRLSVISSLTLLSCGLVWRCRSGFLIFLFPSFVALMMIGLLAVKIKTMLVAAPVLQEEMKGVMVQGFVEAVEQRGGARSRLTVRVVRLADLPAAQRPFRVTVSLRRPCDIEQCQPGSAVELWSFLRPPPMAAVPGGYDFSRMAYFQSIGAVGFAPGLPRVWKEAPRPSLSLRWSGRLERFRGTVAARVRAVLDDDSGAIASALLVGLRGGISETTLKSLRSAGLAHILAVSGLHMSLMAGSLFWFARALLATSPALAQNRPVKKIAAVLSFLGASAYLLLSGMSVSTQRAYVMTVVILLAVFFDRSALTMRNVALAALPIMLIAPESVLTPGFQMSFAATIALIAIHENRNEHRFKGMTGMSFLPYPVRLILWYLIAVSCTALIASVATAPFSSYHFHRLSSFSLIGNVLAMPFLALAVMPCGLAALLLMPFGLERVPLLLMGWGIDWISSSAGFVAALPGADLRVRQIPPFGFALLVASLLWLAIWHHGWRFWSLPVVFLAVILSFWQPGPDLIVDGSGKALAVRDVRTGLLNVLDARRAKFAVERWLERDGDWRDPNMLEPTSFICDALSCVAPLGAGGLVTLIRHASVLGRNCSVARVAIIIFRSKIPCIGPERVIGADDLRVHGTHAVWIMRDGIEVRYARPFPGARPWSPQPFMVAP